MATERICIIGTGLVASAQPSTGLSHKELMFQATRAALDDAGLERADIGGAVTASYDFLEGRGLSNQYTLDSVGGTMKPCDLRVAEDALHALLAAYMEVLADPAQIVVAASVQKGSERDAEGLGFQKLLVAAMDPVFARPVCGAVPNLLGLEPALAAMEARAFMDRTGIDEEDLCRVLVKNRANSVGRKKGKKHGLKDAMREEVLSWPIRRGHIPRALDAACAVLVCSERRARSLPGVTPVMIRGVGWASDTGQFAMRDQGFARETEWAARQAYEMAGIRRPSREIDFAEINDAYPHRELMHCEALGLGGGESLVESVAKGRFDRDGGLPVNVSGGQLGRGAVIGAAGLVSVIETVRQLRGQANGSQLGRAEIGLAHGWNGLPTATAGVAVLSRW